jgi:hypothetical protein
VCRGGALDLVRDAWRTVLDPGTVGLGPRVGRCVNSIWPIKSTPCQRRRRTGAAVRVGLAGPSGGPGPSARVPSLRADAIVKDEATGASAIVLTATLGRALDIRQGAGSQILTRLSADTVDVGGRVRLTT